MPRPPACVLFDFFGTLVEYDDSWTSQGYPRTHAVLVEAGAALDYPAFLRAVDEVFAEHERSAEASLLEYSGELVCTQLARRALESSAVAPDLVDRVRETYIEEWNRCVRPIPGVAAMLGQLATRRRLALVSNTLDTAVVPRHLEALGIARHFTAVVTSIDHGWRKPSPSIFHEALRRLGASAADAIHVGDSFSADYRGAAAAGIECLLIDPERRHDVPDRARIASVLDVATRFDLGA